MDFTKDIVYGVVRWHPDPYYKISEVVKWYKRNHDAQNYCDKYFNENHGYVVRTFYLSDINSLRNDKNTDVYSEMI